MAGTETYEVILTPKEVGLDKATDRRVLTVDAAEDADRETIHEAVVERVSNTGEMDRWACRNHWEVTLFTRPNAPVIDQLKDALLTCRLSDDAWGDLVPTRLNVYNTRRDDWDAALLALEEPVCEDLYEWKGDLKRAHPDVLYASKRCLDTAMIQTVAAVQPNLVAQFAEKPALAHYEFAQACMAHETRVASATIDTDA